MCVCLVIYVRVGVSSLIFVYPHPTLWPSKNLAFLILAINENILNVIGRYWPINFLIIVISAEEYILANDIRVWENGVQYGDNATNLSIWHF